MRSNYHSKIESLLKRWKITYSATFTNHGPHFDAKDTPRDNFRCLFTSAKPATFTVNMGQSIAQSTKTGGNPPTSYYVLAAVTKNDPGDFDSFCSEYGYDNDSRKAEKTWKACCAEWAEFSAFFTPEQIEQLREHAQ